MILLTTLINFGILDYERHKGVSQNPSWFIQKILRARCLRDIFAKPIMKAKSRIRKKYAARKKSYSYTSLVILASSFILSGSIYCYGLLTNNEGTGSQPVPVVHAEVQPSPTPILVETTEIEDHKDSETISDYIEGAVREFLPEHESESLMIMHCLAHRESGHGKSNAHGDSGKAGGPFQFWEGTWDRMRSKMIKDGFATEISNRYDLKEATRTTAYAISKGWGKEWGPILRNSKGSDFADCQTPSWYER